jgi:hypothetical protein
VKTARVEALSSGGKLYGTILAYRGDLAIGDHHGRAFKDLTIPNMNSGRGDREIRPPQERGQQEAGSEDKDPTKS